MICPYICNVEQVNQERYGFNEEGQNDFREHKLVEKKVPYPCAEEKCGAWQGGKCCYRGE